MSDNLKLWESVENTDKEYTEPIDINGKNFTSVKGLYMIKKATEEWGPKGFRWGVRKPHYDNLEFGSSESKGEKDGKSYINITKLILCNYTAELFYPADNGEGIIYIEASRQVSFYNGSVDAFFLKSVATDALNKGLSKLGFCADIYMQTENSDDKLSYRNSGNFSDPFNGKDPLDGPGIKIDDNQESNKLDEDFKNALDKTSFSEQKKKDLIESTGKFVKESFINGIISEMDL